MSTRLQDKQERLEEVFAKLAEKSAKGVPIVVEGKKDQAALRSLGMSGPIFTIKTGGKSFAQAVEEVTQHGVGKAVLLLDFDRRGRQATAHLKAGLERAHITPDLSFDRELAALLGRHVQCIEGIPTFMATLRQKTVSV